MAGPGQTVTNDNVAQMLRDQRRRVIDQGYKLTKEESEQYETDDKWIKDRTGIRERRFAKPGVATSDLASKASLEAIKAGPGESTPFLDFLMLATVSPDHFTTPTTSVITHRKLGLSTDDTSNGPTRRRFMAQDITQACSSFMMALMSGYSLIRGGVCMAGLVTGSDVMSRVMSNNRRSPFMILGDGAGAFLLESATEESSWFGPNAFYAGVDGGPAGLHEQLIINKAGGSALPTMIAHLDPRSDTRRIHIVGRKVFTKLVRLVPDEIFPAALSHAGVSLQDIDVLILHQANLRMTEAIVERLCKGNKDIAIRMATYADPQGDFVHLKGELTPRSVGHEITCYNSIDRYGNTTSAAIPIGVKEAVDLGIIKPGKRVMLIAFGGGFSWCSSIIEWGGRHLPEFNK